jgi:hypothetical protein
VSDLAYDEVTALIPQSVFDELIDPMAIDIAHHTAE